MGQWVSKSYDLSQYISLNNTMKVIVETADWDALGGHLVEGGFDKFEIITQSSTTIQDTQNTKKIVEIVDLFGRKINISNESVLLYIYDDGSVEKKIIFK